tara:strand:- start:494394 stop:494693 length:300 start_codon:yes stop_codon:yes gene_type:complete
MKGTYIEGHRCGTRVFCLFPGGIETGNQNGTHRNQAKDDHDDRNPVLCNIEQRRDRKKADKSEQELTESEKDPESAKCDTPFGLYNAGPTERERNDEKS